MSNYSSLPLRGKIVCHINNMSDEEFNASQMANLIGDEYTRNAVSAAMHTLSVDKIIKKTGKALDPDANRIVTYYEKSKGWDRKAENLYPEVLKVKLVKANSVPVGSSRTEDLCNMLLEIAIKEKELGDLKDKYIEESKKI